MIPRRLVRADGSPAIGKNREHWLTEVAVGLRPWFLARGYEIPLRVRLGVGALAANHGTLGVCHCPCDRDGFQHITISPFIDDPVMVATVLVHELIHAVLPASEGHGRLFEAAARTLGLVGRVTIAEAGPELRAHLREITRAAGPYPHRAIANDRLFNRTSNTSRGGRVLCR